MAKKVAKLKRPTDAQILAALELLIRDKGYAIVGQTPDALLPFEIGDTTQFFAGVSLNGKSLRITSRARFSDWKDQCVLFGEMNPTWPKLSPKHINGAHYFKARLTK